MFPELNPSWSATHEGWDCRLLSACTPTVSIYRLQSVSDPSCHASQLHEYGGKRQIRLRDLTSNILGKGNLMRPQHSLLLFVVRSLIVSAQIR